VSLWQNTSDLCGFVPLWQNISDLCVSVSLWQICLCLSVSLWLIGCASKEPDAGAPTAAVPSQAAAPAQSQGATMPHGDHNPHHGGIVMMKGDLHFEIVSNPAGKYTLYFTDATRADLPAAAAQSVGVTVHRTNEPDEAIAMHIDDAGESWEGTGRKVDKPDDATVRVAFTLKGQQPYWIDLPYRIQK
jgi:hypothetical protein